MKNKRGILEMMALPGFLAVGWFIPRLMGFDMGIAFTGLMLGGIAWGYIYTQATQESEAEKMDMERRWNQRVEEAGRERRAEQWGG